MMLTKDNILRFIQEKKAVTPTMIAESFETSTMIASAALSELAKDKLIAITYLKLASSPYYYDPKQKSHLMILGEQHLSKYEKEVFLKLKEKEILNDAVLSIQERLAIEKIKDFAIPLEINSQEKTLKFWVWYMRDIEETKKSINDALNSQNKPASKKEEPKQKIQTTKTKTQNINSQTQDYNNQNFNSQPQTRSPIHQFTNSQNSNLQSHMQFKPEENQIETFIDNFFRQNYLGLEKKNKKDKGISYEVTLKLSNITIRFDCFYFYKKPLESDIMKFYTSSIKPKIIFIENSPKKLLSLSDNLENLTIINI